MPMDTMNETENRNDAAANTEPSIIHPPLNKVISNIEMEIEMIPDSISGAVDDDEDMAIAGNSPRHQFILFALEGNFFALPLASALEVGHRPAITPLPQLPKWILGISNIRGEIISLINLKIFFGIPSTGTKGEGRFIIIYNQNMKTGIIVDEIPGILSLDRIDADIQNSPYRHGEILKYISGVSVSSDRLINILDADRLLTSRRLKELAEV